MIWVFYVGVKYEFRFFKIKIYCVVFCGWFVNIVMYIFLGVFYYFLGYRINNKIWIIVDFYFSCSDVKYLLLV